MSHGACDGLKILSVPLSARFGLICIGDFRFDGTESASSVVNEIFCNTTDYHVAFDSSGGISFSVGNMKGLSSVLDSWLL